MPILLVVNVPANAMVRVLDPSMVGFTLVARPCPCSGSAAGSSSMRCGRTAARAAKAGEREGDAPHMHLELLNIGQINHADVVFGDLTVFVGPQATGKSIALNFSN